MRLLTVLSDRWAAAKAAFSAALAASDDVAQTRGSRAKARGDEEKRLLRFVRGFGDSGAMQAPPGAPGDPQLAALHQYLQTKLSLAETEIVLDLGSGLGILPHAMAHVWRDLPVAPCYYAVDLPEILEQLALPAKIHNNSRKVPIHEFLEYGLGVAEARVRVVVLRNILHELDIPTTAQVLHAIAKVLSDGAEVYIQDMARLPVGERGNVGWNPDLLVGLLNTLGFACGQALQLPSHSGTPWFSVIARKEGTSPALAVFEARVKSMREAQRAQVIRSIQALNKDSDERTTAEYVMLQSEEASIATQLQQVSYSQAAALSVPGERRVVASIPLVAVPLTPVDYAEEIPESISRRSGLVAIISSKNHLDFPALIAACRKRVYFSGYSQRSLLRTVQNRMGLQTALSAGAEVRVLLCDPESKAAAARADALAYSNPRDLTSDIRNTLRDFNEFRESLPREDGSCDRCQVRLTATIPSSAYFILDDLCYVSLYSLRLTGGMGPCLVFKNDPDEVNAYFFILLQDFQLAWENIEESRA